MKNVKKEHLQSKICLVCLKPFSWRKKWAKNWGDVKYCSDRCRREKQSKSD
ncbi:DUF2256 domain-containing protein [Pedobacter paludis]|uniref:DUF2256 domain-containing protein n=1 Tax=Pedobacter paludis TaxID=2203212 RepID=A0A317EXK2_9SPHI|nr:DUF2256 domain-containing protein [Pedobacter paludis]PWS31544.1 DUF2256 domain-containing protein [Pedobacter paludis]